MLPEAFLYSQGRTYVYANTYVRTTWRCKYRVLAVQFDLDEKNSWLCLCCMSSELILTLWYALKQLTKIGPNLWLHIGEVSTLPFQSVYSIKCLWNATVTYISSMSFCSGEISPNEHYVQVGFNHDNSPLTCWGYIRANVPYSNYLHCPLSVGEMWGIWYTKANMAVKRQSEDKTAMVLTKFKIPANLLLVMNSA